MVNILKTEIHKNDKIMSTKINALINRLFRHYNKVYFGLTEEHGVICWKFIKDNDKYILVYRDNNEKYIFYEKSFECVDSDIKIVSENGEAEILFLESEYDYNNCLNYGKC